MKWRASSLGRTFEDDDDLVVYYSQGSGSTHLINPVAAFLLELVTVRPRSTEELLQHMASEVDDVPVEELKSILENLLDELQGSELIEAG